MKTTLLQIGLLYILLFTTGITANAKSTEASSTVNCTANPTATTVYVLAPNGLSLRKTKSLDSEKLAVMRLGSAVTLLEAASEISLEIEHIKGGMHKVSYNGQIGYAFSGFLGAFALRKPEEQMANYLGRLQEKYPSLSYESKNNGPNFHEGVTETFTLPANNWPKAFYAAATACAIPKSLGFPSPLGPTEETIADPEKPTDVWGSDLNITRNQNNLEKIVYGFRTEGFGSAVTIERDSDTTFRVTYLRFVD
jgi:hypothetical protein